MTRELTPAFAKSPGIGRRRIRALVAAAASLAVGLSMTVGTPASAKPTQPVKAAKNKVVNVKTDVREISPKRRTRPRSCR